MNKNNRRDGSRAVKDLPARKTQDVKGGRRVPSVDLSAKGGGEDIRA